MINGRYIKIRILNRRRGVVENPFHVINPVERGDLDRFSILETEIFCSAAIKHLSKDKIHFKKKEGYFYEEKDLKKEHPRKDDYFWPIKSLPRSATHYYLGATIGIDHPGGNRNDDPWEGGGAGYIEHKHFVIFLRRRQRR